jgi:hypothetical protein
LAIRSLRRDASAWQATRSYGSGPALFPKGIRFLLRWNRPIGTGCLSGRRPAQLAAVYLLSSRIGLWRRVLPHISHGRIDFSSVSLRGIDPRDYPVYRAAKGLYCGKLLITSAELADEEQVSSEAFGDILNAMLIARYGKTIIAAEVKK